MIAEAKFLPRLLLTPSLIASALFIYGSTLWTGVISLTNSRFLPQYQFVGLAQYFKLFQIERWLTSCLNLVIFTALFLLLTLSIGLLLAILLDQSIRAQSLFKSIYLYPMAISFIVTGTVWKWLLNPELGIAHFLRQLGMTYHLDLINNPKLSLYAIVLAAVWQSCGFVMAIFLAGLRGIDDNIVRAAKMDGANTFELYALVLVPQLKTAFFTAFVLMAQVSVKSFDIVVALTGGGLCHSSDLPSTFMYDYSFARNRLALGSSSAMIMLFLAFLITIPYLIKVKRGGGDGQPQ